MAVAKRAGLGGGVASTRISTLILLVLRLCPDVVDCE